MSPANGHPFSTFNFAVEITEEGASRPLCNAAFSECDGLEMSMEVKTIREGGFNERQHRLAGPITYGQLTLKRGVTGNLDLWEWFNRVLANPRRRASAEVVMFAGDGQTVVVSYALSRCLPVKLKAPPLNASAAAVAIEELQLAYETLTVKRAGE